MSLVAWLSLAAAVAPLAVWGLRAYVARVNQAAVVAERKAGADQSKVDAQNAEIDRVTRAVDAAGRVPVGQSDPNDRDGAHAA